MGYYAALLQEIGRYALVGIRTDHYFPNDMHTYSPLAGALLPDRVRLLVHHAMADQVGRDARGAPTDLRNDRITIRIQGEL